MPYYFYIWTDESIAHLAEHDVTPAEFEEVLKQPDFIDQSRTTGNPVAFGTTSTGRILCCVFQRLDEVTIQPITAYEIAE